MTTTESPVDAGPLQPDLAAADEHEITTADIGTIDPPAELEAAEEDRDRRRVEEAMAEFREGPTLEERRERLPEIDRWAQMEAMAHRLANASTMPKHIRESRDKEADVMVILLAAHDLGLNATTAFQKVNVIEGRPALSSELMRTLIIRDGHSLTCEVERDDDGRAVAVTWIGRRKDNPDSVIEGRFSITDAVDAHLCSIDADTGRPRARSGGGKALPWETYTEDLLSARATSRLARKGFPDCLAGCSYTPEELGTISVEPLREAEPPTDPPVSEQHLGALRENVAAMTTDQREWLAEEWKRRGLGSLKPDGKMRVLVSSEMVLVAELLAQVKTRAPEDAEIIPPGPPIHPFEGHDGSDECATCGHPREHDLHATPDTGQSDVPVDGPETPSEAPGAVEPAEGATPAGGASAMRTLEMTARVAKMTSKGVRDRLESWQLPVTNAEQHDREALIAAMLERVLCGECGKLQLGPHRVGEAMCSCPF